MNFKAIAMIAGAAVLVGSLAACGHHHFNQAERGEHAAWMVERMGRDLDLNEAQKAKLEVVKSKLLAAGSEAAKQHEADKGELINLLSQPTLDRTRAETLVMNHLRAIEAKTPDVINAVGDFYDSLTPAQQQKLRERVNSHLND